LTRTLLTTVYQHSSTVSIFLFSQPSIRFKQDCDGGSFIKKAQKLFTPCFVSQYTCRTYFNKNVKILYNRQLEFFLIQIK